MRGMVERLTPAALAIKRQLQWAAPGGVSCNVACRMACTWWAVISGLRPRPRSPVQHRRPTDVERNNPAAPVLLGHGDRKHADEVGAQCNRAVPHGDPRQGDTPPAGSCYPVDDLRGRLPRTLGVGYPARRACLERQPGAGRREMRMDRVEPTRTDASASTSQELLERAREGDSGALNRLFVRYLPRLHRWAHRRVPTWARDAADTADFVQETVFHTLRRLDSFKPQRDGALLGYLRRSLVNRVHDQFRRASRRPQVEPLVDGLDERVSNDEEIAARRGDRPR